MPPRLTISRLSRLTCASTLAAEFAARLARQRDALQALQPLPGARTALDRLLRAHDEAQAAASPAAAVAPLEVGTSAAVESLRGADADVAHAVLRRAFGTLVAARVVGWRHGELSAGEAGGEDGGGGQGEGEAGGGGSMFAAGAVDLAALAEASVDDAASFCREKYGAAPEAELLLVGEPLPPGALLLAPLAAFALHEVLKNAMGAHVRRVGGDAGRLDELPPLRVSVGACGATGFVKVEDQGGGWPAGTDGARALRFLYSTNPPREANYTYSRNFGAPFEGLGVGLPLAHLHASLLGGSLTLAGLPGRGVTALLCFDLSGEAPSHLSGGEAEEEEEEEEEEAVAVAATLPRFRAPPPRQLHGFASSFARQQREFRTAMYSKREPRSAADDAAAVAAAAAEGYVGSAAKAALGDLEEAAAAAAVATAAAAAGKGGVRSDAAADLARLCASVRSGEGARTASLFPSHHPSGAAEATAATITALEDVARRLLSFPSYHRPSERRDDPAQDKPAAAAAVAAEVRLRALGEAAAERAAGLRLMAEVARRAAAGEPPLTEHLADAAPLVRRAAEEARRAVAAARGGGGSPPVAVLGGGGGGSPILTAPEPLRRALTGLLSSVLEARGSPVELELSTGDSRLGLRLAAAAPPPRRWDGVSGANPLEDGGATLHAARDSGSNGRSMGGSSSDGGGGGGGDGGGCWDADAIRLVEQLGGSVEMVTTPGLVAEAFVTLPRGGAGYE